MFAWVLSSHCYRFTCYHFVRGLFQLLILFKSSIIYSLRVLLLWTHKFIYNYLLFTFQTVTAVEVWLWKLNGIHLLVRRDCYTVLHDLRNKPVRPCSLENVYLALPYVYIAITTLTYRNYSRKSVVDFRIVYHGIDYRSSILVRAKYSCIWD